MSNSVIHKNRVKKSKIYHSEIINSDNSEIINSLIKKNRVDRFCFLK